MDSRCLRDLDRPMGPSIDPRGGCGNRRGARRMRVSHSVNIHDIHNSRSVSAHSEVHSCWKETLVRPPMLLLANKAHRTKLEHRLDFVLYRGGNLTRATRERYEVHEETRRLF